MAVHVCSLYVYTMISINLIHWFIISFVYLRAPFLSCTGPEELETRQLNGAETPNITTLRIMTQHNGTAHSEKCKQLFEYQHSLLLRDISWSKL